ncbi:DUF6087 family protein [Streptomyces sp. NPDC005728]|uniref:DUF6087 family protein n=1 Tax=Streptomyces sp. NPDC005728 TaxID=3157054 RepID=UPI0033C88E70
MGKHRREGPPDQPSRAVAGIDPGNPLAAYERRRRPPMDVWRKQRPLHGGAGHVHPDQPRALLAWNGFTYEMTGTAQNLAAAQQWVNTTAPGTEPENA